jgi:hypothetical protein
MAIYAGRIAMEYVETTTTGALGVLAERDLTKGVIVVLSGGPFDWMNPIEVRNRMDQIINDINADPWVLANSGGKGLTFRLLEGQQSNHIHQARWKELCESPELLAASPLVIIGHSNGGGAAMDLARYLDGHGRSMDLLFTADSVLTLEDNGDPYQLPLNVRLNLNSYSIPVFPIWLTVPFPFGQKNHRQSDGSLDGILNIGLPFEEAGALEHRDVFYALAGGDPNGNSYKYPELIRDSTLAVLKRATNQEVFQLAERYLQALADGARISVYLEGDGFRETLEPSGTATRAQTSLASDSTISDLHQQMMAIERMRLTIR